MICQKTFKPCISARMASTSSVSRRHSGAGLQPSDANDGQDPQPVVVLGYKFWQRHFKADPTVVGKTMQMVRKNYTIVGVAASRFTWGDADVYLPLKVTQDQVRSYYAGVRLQTWRNPRAGGCGTATTHH